MSKGLILVFTGNGKGKTTAAMGCAMRMMGHGKQVGMVQFFKRATHNAQRTTLMLKTDSLSVDRCALRVWSFGGGFTWKVARKKNQQAVDQAWKKCCELLNDPKYSLVILDEIHIALRYKFLKAAEVVKALKKRPAGQHVILTGREAPRTLLKAADLVTDMKCVKHPFDRGVPAQLGIEF